MKAVVSRLLSVIGCAFIFAAAWFCLWSISLHLVERADLAVLLFPFGRERSKTKKFSRFHLDAVSGQTARWFLQCLVMTQA